MSGVKLAASWADLLLIAVLTVVGAGLCVLSVVGVSLVMNPRAPKETILRDRLRLPLLEQSLTTVREDRAFILAQRREIDMRLMHETTALRMAENDLGSFRSANGRTDSLRRDSIALAQAVLQRSIRADSLIALQLLMKMAVLDDTVAARAHRFDFARDSLDHAMQLAKAWHGALEKLLSTVAAALVVALMLFAVTRVMRPSVERPAVVQLALVVPVAAALIAIFLMYQLGGLLFTLGVGAAAAMVLLRRVARAST